MPTHAEKRIVPYTPDQMYQLVLDVEKYPDFLPWVLSAHVYNQTETEFHADLSVGSSLLNQSYSSKVICQPHIGRIDVQSTKGPFQRLINYWIFTPHHAVFQSTDPVPTKTEIEFFLDFEISNPFLKPLLQPFLNQAVSVMVDAFEKRAHSLFS